MDKVFKSLGATNHKKEGNREVHDYYATDPRAVEMLCDLEGFSRTIWEPACGEGHIAKVLESRGYEVVATDLIDRGFGKVYDFLGFMGGGE